MQARTAMQAQATSESAVEAEVPGSAPGAWKWDIRKKMWNYMEDNNIARYKQQRYLGVSTLRFHGAMRLVCQLKGLATSVEEPCSMRRIVTNILLNLQGSSILPYMSQASLTSKPYCHQGCHLMCQSSSVLLHCCGRFPRPVHHRIPNFVLAEKAADNLSKLPEFIAAACVKVNPDTPQKMVRGFVQAYRMSGRA